MKNFAIFSVVLAGSLFPMVQSEAKSVHSHTSTSHTSTALNQSYILSLEWIKHKSKPARMMWVLRHGQSSIAALSLQDHKLQDYISHLPRGTSIVLIEAGEYSVSTLAGYEDISRICKRRGILLGGITT